MESRLVSHEKIVDISLSLEQPTSYQATDSEEIEVVTITDLLARAGVRVTVAHVGHDHPQRLVKLVRGTNIQSDKSIEYCLDDEFDLIAIPGGPGAKELGASTTLTRILQRHVAARKLVGAICAAPVEVLHRNSLVPGIPMTCHPLLKDQLGELYMDDAVVTSDEVVVTSQAPGTAIPMVLRLIELVRGPKVAADVSAAISFSFSK